MKALCNHLARKNKAHYEGDKGYIEFIDGKCEVIATANALTFHAEAESADALEHVKRVVGKHLLRFTPGEDIQFTWSDLS